MNEEVSAEQFIQHVVKVAHAVGWQSGTGAMEIAGNIVSNLGANPEHLARFMSEGAGLFIDGTFSYDKGCLTFQTSGGDIGGPHVLRQKKGTQQ